MPTIETRTDPMTINMGPHHPSMHGVLRLIVTLDAEGMFNEAVTVNAVEQLAGIPIPQRASYIRVIMLELI